MDRGGTFTDCIGVAPDGSVHVAKLLSSDAAPVEGVRQILARAGASDAAAASVRLGTTVATNALLERRGVPLLLVANRGLGDVLEIGTQERPELFALAIEKPLPLAARVAEVSGRVGVDGEEVEAFDPAGARAVFESARAAGIDSVAISLIHAYAYPELEARLAALARELGFAHVVAGHEIARELGLLARGETASVDAYLTPLLRAHVEALQAELPHTQLRLMQSSGGLTEAARFRGPFALLSGPAGGVVGARAIAARAGCARAIGLDMGGTSTDVSLLREGEVDRSFETLVGGVRVKAPMLRIHTVAAGGGSLCRFDGFRLTVGPESAGSEPGPLCYGRSQARELALTDVNFHLGRVAGDRFPFPLHEEPVARGLERMGEALAKAGHAMPQDEIAAGFVAVANASMAQAIAQVSVARGVDPRDCALVGFGGAAGQHVCAIARELGMRQILLHPFAGILSAYGIGRAAVSWDGQRDAGRVPLADSLPENVRADFAGLEAQARRTLAREGVAEADIQIERCLDLRVQGAELPLPVVQPADGDWVRAFAAEHRARFGYDRPGRAVEIVTTRVRASATQRGWRDVAPPAPPETAPAAPLRHASVWFPECGRVEAPVYAREALVAGQCLEGPALLLEDTGSIVLDPGFTAELGPEGILLLTDRGTRAARAAASAGSRDPIRLEVFGNRFMSIAEQMGAVLRNTSVSTNIKERLDYSCAVFDVDGGLVANAPHIPVHLGAMSETVRVARARFPDLEAGDVVVTNDPHAGGSHLPDVTVVTPVFAGAGAAGPAFFVASRGHHADIGGITPGSMPADSTSLEEEGVCIAPFRLVRRGRFEEAAIREMLASGRYPARSPDDNVAELEAMVAANRQGEKLLLELAEEHGVAEIGELMRALQQAAAGKVAGEIEKLADGEHRFSDQMDDGTPLCVTLRIEGPRMQIDFAGSGAVHPGNLNAPRAVVNAAVIYVLRALVNERIPLNGGCLAPVEIFVPPASLLDPPPGAAVVGGNVETSQRIVDVLLGALGLAAASQGTMNNVAFGDDTFGYYETIGGGSGATPEADGASGVHSHMTNTRITDPEVLETRYPVRLLEFALRRGSGGAGRTRGGDGLVRRYGFLAPVTLSLLGERRAVAAWGLAGGAAGDVGRNAVSRAGGAFEPVAGRATLRLAAGDVLRIETPGGGGFG
ncbi:MAG: hydantoinase B/oxoprolinase family protein [Deltaproteobacteria bacterium]|nr:hydantoinase B/oxoprolinase family protein [Deltaproteobacteria bacterium]MBW2360666.1 hydantoinase B/oxoprolinase family protein [Deltaproteobacteria bacterium]